MRAERGLGGTQGSKPGRTGNAASSRGVGAKPEESGRQKKRLPHDPVERGKEARAIQGGGGGVSAKHTAGPAEADPRDISKRSS